VIKSPAFAKAKKALVVLISVHNKSCNILIHSGHCSDNHSMNLANVHHASSCQDFLNSSVVIEDICANFVKFSHHKLTAFSISINHLVTAEPQASALIHTEEKAVAIQNISSAVNQAIAQPATISFEKSKISFSVVAKLLPNHTTALHILLNCEIGTFKTFANLAKAVQASSSVRFVVIHI
jgi:O6-methylguanine-DNA--protein-cysteine methyltransferase